MITEFRGDYRFLSNFYPAAVYLDGVQYPTVEHAFQAAKSTRRQYREKILMTESPGKAKREGRSLPVSDMIPQWERIRLEVMADLLMQKFFHPDLRAQLLATGEEELIEGNTWGDTFWGVCRGEGLNKLGQLLMVVRQMYRVIEGNPIYEKSLIERVGPPVLPV